MTAYQRGYLDGVDGKPPQHNGRAYRAGYRHGADPQWAKSEQEVFGEEQPREKDMAWGLDYRNVDVEGFHGWMITLIRLSDGKMLSCRHSGHRPQVREVRSVMARGLLHNKWPEILWVDEWLSQFAAAECKKYGIRMHIRMFRKGGLEVHRDEYAARLDRAIGRPLTTQSYQAGRRFNTPESIKRHWVN